jgi:REP element-mobilizing transposase RayT
MKNHRGTDQLRRGRVSIPGARYFITCCTEKRVQGLNRRSIRDILVETLRKLHGERNFELHCAVIMPDHIHSLLTLGQNLTLAQTQSKFKTKTNEVLRDAGLSWQENFYDHRIRSDGFLEPFAQYCFLNPYRKGLVNANEVWPDWILSKHYRPAFSACLLNGSYPPLEWLGKRLSINDIIELDLAAELGQGP